MGHLDVIFQRIASGTHLDALTTFGLVAVSAMLACYAMEDRAPIFVLGFAIACLMGSAYGFLQGAWPFGLVEGIWALIAVRKWIHKQFPDAHSD